MKASTAASAALAGAIGLTSGLLRAARLLSRAIDELDVSTDADAEGVADPDRPSRPDLRAA